MTTNNNHELISIDNLSKAFKKQEVIKNLTIHFREKERIALIGQNGAGKTTLIRCILGQYNYEGDMKVFGMNPRKERKDILQHIGFVPQMPPPIKLTVKELLNFFVTITKTPADTFIRLSHEMGLPIEDNYHKPFFKLSGGMKQKLLISFALGRQPKILLLDEPSANLDPQARTILFDHLRNFPLDTLMILSSHRMDEISGLVNRVVEMDLGNVVLDKIISKQT
ncbi:MAG: ABC transporter ATP-binding protein [Bacteroidales bacterium]|jgi:ABC-2 type transport system ATP-binding protein|nr:ABC transporter ATP-binding protein [Bacteroidales bacterium]MCK9448278.1 ABC transporter ATP-binding protein [Bacteroidales bacterium]MDD3700460.1 ABC transporter ATP-binding protein [Bacteroidales bacterium]MDY0368654.1 ABC transporter ATP-binding protein [Bacteroidales bacterium]